MNQQGRANSTGVIEWNWKDLHLLSPVFQRKPDQYRDQQRPGRENRAATNRTATSHQGTAEQTPPRPAPTQATTARKDRYERTRAGPAPTHGQTPPNGTAERAPSPRETGETDDTRPRAPQEATAATPPWPGEPATATAAEPEQRAEPQEPRPARNRRGQTPTTETRPTGTGWQRKHTWQTSQENEPATGRPTGHAPTRGARAKEHLLERATRVLLVVKVSCKSGLSTPRAGWPGALEIARRI